MKTKTNLLAAGIFLTALISAVCQPVITTDPQSRTNLVGTDATFTLLATGTGPLAYQWRFSTTELVGKTNDTLVVTNVQTANAGNYTVVVTNVEGAVTSLVATLTVVTPPWIFSQPANQTASLFADATFRVTVKGDVPFSYQWRFNDADLIGKTNTTLTVTNVQRADAGTHYSVVVTNHYGSVTSQVATLTIVTFNSIYCFGDSWTATHLNCLFTSDPTRYYRNHACNGPVWPEFLSTNLGLAYVDANNYAQCGATTLEIYAQASSALRVPPKPELSLYSLYDPGTDFLQWFPPDGYRGVYVDLTNAVASIQIIDTAVKNVSNTVQRLYARGARAFLAINQFGTNDVDVALFGASRAGLYDGYIKSFNAKFAAAMDAFSRNRLDVRIYWVDFYSLWHEISTHPTAFGFTEILISALDDTRLTDKSFTGPGANYLLWDGGHATTKLHALWATRNFEALTNSILEKLDVTITGNSPSIQMNHLLIGRDYTLQGSPDLGNWQDIQTFTAAAGTNRWTETSEGAPAAFYRLKWQP